MSIRISESWKKVLEKEFQTDYFNNISLKTREEYSKFVCYPPGSKLFRAFDECPFNKLKVVIIGQDPYHGKNQANGLCFSVDDGVEKPPSLKNIFKELNTSFTKNERTNSDLSDWSNQGVLLLNTCLTVSPGKPGSHSNLGWQEFTDAVIRAVDTKNNIVFMLWGSYAQKKKELLSNKMNLILEAPHPSPLSAHRGFFGCKHFSKANEFLKTNNSKDIDWIS